MKPVLDFINRKIDMRIYEFFGFACWFASAGLIAYRFFGGNIISMIVGFMGIGFACSYASYKQSKTS